MKIEFAPLNVPLQRRLQTAATLQWVFSFLALAQCCLAAFVLLALSDWWMVALLYAGWLWLDWDTPTSGGRRSQWVRTWSVWDYFRDYFPLTLVKTADLDPKKNYIFGFHPHGVLVAGGFGNFCTEATGFSRLFPGLKPHLLMLPFWFRVPLFRDYIMCGGLVSSCKSSLSYLVSRPEGGNVAVIAVGGAPEALDARPGALTLQVRNRKGFIKLALKHGAQLVPVFSFGENELFDQMENPTGSPLRKLQNRLQSIMGVAMPLFHARGVFQYSFGLMPYRKPIHTVVGKPISVVQTPSPSSEDIERLHEVYLQSLTDLFEQHKHTYGLTQSYIPCKSYQTSSFCIFFNIQRQLLPAFAALAGNDYVKLQRTESSISWTQFSPAGSGTPGSRLEGLLCWLRGFQQPQEALEAALGLMKELSSKRKAEVLQSLYLGMEEYQLPPSSLKRFFIHGTAPPFPAVEEVAGLVPDWTLLPLTQAQLTPDVLDVLLLQRMPLGFPVDHADMPSANLISRPLRQVMYGLLLGRRRQLQVQERDRDGLQLKYIPVQPAFTRVTKQLKLNSLDKVELPQRLQVLLEALGVTEASLSRLPPELRLPVAVTCYWLQKAQPAPDQNLLKALLLGLSNGDALRQRAALQLKNQHFKPKLDVGVAHAFNQWQACLKHSIHLNQLLGFPLPEPQIARLYEGTVVHQLVHTMRKGGKLKNLLKSDRSNMKLYQTVLAVIHQFHTQKASTPSETQKTATAPQRQPLDDLTANLQQLFLLYEDDEETATEASSVVRVHQDLHLVDLVSVKTRYRAKERNNRCKNPEMARKAECRGQDLL